MPPLRFHFRLLPLLSFDIAIIISYYLFSSAIDYAAAIAAFADTMPFSIAVIELSAAFADAFIIFAS
jgi:hypothetical protein